jgi:biopolymer transport protein ExbB
MDIVGFLLKITLGGSEWVLWLLLVLSVVSVAIMIERYVFFSANTVKVGPFVTRLQEYLEKGDSKGASEWLRDQHSPEARVVQSGLTQVERGPEAAEEAMIGVQLQERFRLEKNLSFLGTLANNAPFIGLFGTVLGIIKAFNDLANAQSGGPSVVMAGISEALVATAVGLFVAIPAVIAFNYFSRRAKRVMANMETYSKLILTHLKGRRQVQ